MARLEIVVKPSPEQKEVLKHIQNVRGTPFSEIWLAMLHNPVLTKRISDLGQALRFEGILPGSIREAAILFIANSTKSSYEWAAHHGVAQKEGISEKIISLIKEGKDFHAFPEPYRDIIETAQITLQKKSIPEALQYRLESMYGVEGTIELVILCGCYQMIAAFLNGFDVPLPPGMQKAF
jgi:4-carboxymuconolactone decarboxylase